ncbi:MAG TPA: hypothetical protein VLN49_20165 [Gemmatimonadaceae bacterium]|nr:hypothetical protein [Gemmatimonadaceae bacterium]
MAVSLAPTSNDLRRAVSLNCSGGESVELARPPSGIVVDAISPDVVIASASNGVFRTEDGGTFWQRSAGLPANANPGNPASELSSGELKRL